MNDINAELLSVMRKYPDYEIKGIVESGHTWGWLIEVHVDHSTRTIKLCFGYKF